MHKILIIDDDARLVENVETYFQASPRYMIPIAMELRSMLARNARNSFQKIPIRKRFIFSCPETYSRYPRR